MRNIIFKGLLIVLPFFACWYILYQVPWTKLLNVEKISNSTEEKLGTIFWDAIKNSEHEIKTNISTGILDSIKARICDSNNIDKNKIKLHLLKNEEINAVALPGNHLVIFSGLVAKSENPDELAGVIAHEIAHLESGHIMNKLLKEFGLSVLLSISTGGNNAEISREAIKMLTSSAYDRKIESEADLKATDYLINSNINPEHFATLLFKLSLTESEIVKKTSWISTHPGTEKRVADIMEYSKHQKFESKPIISEEGWNKLKIVITEND